MAGPHRPEYSAGKIFYADFGGEKCDFFDFFQNIAISCRMVNIGFLGAFRGPEGRFPAKYHISGHYIIKYRFFKNRNFSKIDILLYSGQKYDIWPEIDPLDTGKSPESLY